MRKATHHSDGVDSLNPRCWRGKRLHHHDGGVCWLFVLLWMDSWRHELIVCKKWYKNNLKMRLTVLLFDPPRRAPHPVLLPAQAPPCQRHSSYICDMDLLVVRHTSKKLLALLNHSLWGVHIADGNQSFTSWGVQITGRNWASSNAVENQAGIVHEQNTNINKGKQAIYCAEYRKITAVNAALKFAEISHYNKGSNCGTKWQDKH